MQAWDAKAQEFVASLTSAASAAATPAPQPAPAAEGEEASGSEQPSKQPQQPNMDDLQVGMGRIAMGVDVSCCINNSHMGN